MATAEKASFAHYSAFGETGTGTTGTGTTGTGGTRTAFIYMFAGYEAEAAAGLYNAGARLYSARLRMFLSTDAKLEGSSPYLYCGNDPFTYFDPDGNSSLSSMIGMIVSLVAAVIASAVAIVVTMGAAAAPSIMADVLIGAAIGGGSAFLGGAAELTTAAAQGEVISSSRALNALLLQPAIAAVAGGAGSLVGGALAPKMSYLAAIGKADDLVLGKTPYAHFAPLTNYIITHNSPDRIKLLMAPVYAAKNMFASTAAGAASGAVYGALEDLTSGGQKFADDVKAGALMGLAAGFAGGFRIGKDYYRNIHGDQYIHSQLFASYRAQTMDNSEWHISMRYMAHAVRHAYSHMAREIVSLPLLRHLPRIADRLFANRGVNPEFNDEFGEDFGQEFGQEFMD
jgi:RHS repeat-associated protein